MWLINISVAYKIACYYLVVNVITVYRIGCVTRYANDNIRVPAVCIYWGDMFSAENILILKLVAEPNTVRKKATQMMMILIAKSIQTARFGNLA